MRVSIRAYVVEKCLDEYVKKHPKQKYHVPIVQGIISSFLYSLIIILVVLIASTRYELSDIIKLPPQQATQGSTPAAPKTGG
jgi:hypothetical protein